jgi:hypothetical protein
VPSNKSEPEQDLSHWRVGARVRRVDRDETGTIVEVDGKIKVKWDSGRTSYYQPGKPANIRLKDD